LSDDAARHKRIVERKYEEISLEYANCFDNCDIVVFTTHVHKRKKHVAIEPTLKKEK